MTGNSQRIPPLPEQQWDWDARALIQSSWSGAPSVGHDFFKTFVRHRELFREWNEYGKTIFNGVLPRRDRELVVLRVAWLTRCRFEWAHHEGLAYSVGITPDDVSRTIEGPDAPGWSEFDRALVRCVDDLHRTARISNGVWSVLTSRYNEQQLIELPFLVGQYTQVAYFLNTIGVEPDPSLPGLPDAPAGEHA